MHISEIHARFKKIRGEPNASTDGYWKNLGEFIECFSIIEAIIQHLLWHEAKTDPKTARAVYSGVRVKQAIEYIHRIWEAHGTTPDPVLEKIFTQLSHINAARNDIVHFGAQFVDGEPSHVTNEQIAHIGKRVRSFPISSRLLTIMSFELMLMSIYIQMYLDKDILTEETYKRLTRSFLRKPWLYKHSPRSGDPDKPPEQQAPPRSSRV